MKINNQSLEKLRKKNWDDTKSLVTLFKQELKKFNDPLFNIQNHKALPKNKKKTLKELYNSLLKYTYNLEILEEEFRQENTLNTAEQNVILDISEHLLSEIFSFFETLQEKLEQ